jgi:hypothetical protein
MKFYKNLPSDVSPFDTPKNRILYLILGPVFILLGILLVHSFWGYWNVPLFWFGFILISWGVVLFYIRMRLENKIIKYNRELINKQKENQNKKEGKGNENH